MKPFYELTAVGRTRRLRPMALKVLEHYDLNATHLKLMLHETNAIYRVDCADGARHVVRIMSPGEHTDQQIQSQAIWLAELGRQGINVSYPIPNRNGELITQVSVPGIPETRQGMLCTWLPGVNLANRITMPNIERQGALMAQMHTCSETFTRPVGFEAKPGYRLFPYFEPFILHDPAYLTPLEEPVREQVRYLIPLVEHALAFLHDSKTELYLLHGDLHQWNVMINHQTVYALDFDDLLLGYPIQDIGISLYYYQMRENFEEIRAAFRRGYESVRLWPESYPGEVEIWMVWRTLALLNGVLWSDDPDVRTYIGWCVKHLKVSVEALNGMTVPEM